MLKIAVFGYGHTGKAVVEAVEAAGDMELCGVIMRTQSTGKAQVSVPVVDDVNKLANKPDVAILCTPSRIMPEIAEKCLMQGINTVDSYDMHKDIWELRERLDSTAKKNGSTAVVSAGIDPGCDSVVRALMEALAPHGITYTNFGPGMSMGHTVAVKAIEGVKNALSMTIPLGTSLHRRMVYIELHDGYDFNDVTAKIKSDPYFCNDETHVYLEKDVDALIDVGHCFNITRKGASGKTHNQLFDFTIKANNPALTAQALVACARASMKQEPGAYTMIELPIVEMLEGNKEKHIRRLV